jgi:hypothetical protein
VFVGLQYNPEATIDYAVESADLIDYHVVLRRLIARLTGAGFAVFVKDHPAMFGLRQRALYAALVRFPGVTFVPYAVPARPLIEACKTTFSWTGTVAFEAAVAGRCAVVARGAYYTLPGYFVELSTLADIDSLPERIEAFAPPADPESQRRALVRHALRCCVPGNADLAEDFRRRRPGRVERAAPTVQSINALLPLFARAAQPTYR